VSFSLPFQAGCEPHYTNLWKWHALEETEHKAVAFDVFTLVRLAAGISLVLS